MQRKWNILFTNSPESTKSVEILIVYIKPECSGVYISTDQALLVQYGRKEIYFDFIPSFATVTNDNLKLIYKQGSEYCVFVFDKEEQPYY